jgi:hypothetical protein
LFQDTKAYLNAHEGLKAIYRAVQAEEAVEETKKEAALAIQSLNNNPHLRKALFLLPHNHPFSPSIEDVISFFFGVLSPSPANIYVSESIFKKRSHKSIELAERQEYVRKLFTDNGPLSHIWAYFPYLVKLNHHRSVPFLVNVIGDAVMTGNGHVNPLDIFHRLELAQKEASTFSHTAHVKNANLGKAWTKHVAGGREALLNVQKGVADFLKEMSKKGYLDQLACVSIPNSSTIDPAFSVINNQQNNRPTIDDPDTPPPLPVVAQHGIS